MTSREPISYVVMFTPFRIYSRDYIVFYLHQGSGSAWVARSSRHPPWIRVGLSVASVFECDVLGIQRVHPMLTVNPFAIFTGVF